MWWKKEKPEKSILYKETKRYRQAIQAANYKVIMSGLENMHMKTGEQKVDLSGLNINKKILDTTTLTVDISRQSTYVVITNPENNETMCYRKFWYEKTKIEHKYKQGETPAWLVRPSYMQTSIGYEGHGFGKAILHLTELMIPQLASIFARDMNVIIAHCLATSNGSEESSTQSTHGYRHNWTSNMLQKLGYINDFRLIKELLGPNKFKQENINKQSWVKQFN